jgi:protein TonB
MNYLLKILKNSINIFILLCVLVVFLPGVEASEKIFELNEVDKKPFVKLKKTPNYPLDARRQHVEGKVVLQFLIGMDGKVSNIEVVSSEPEGVFDEAAVEAVAKWVFVPAFVGGAPVNTRVKMPLRFNL